MISRLSAGMIRRSFARQLYRFTEIPDLKPSSNFGIYINVPLCYSKCSFCPFYKELYTDDLKERYLKAVPAEIRSSRISGEPRWIYFGGGTPNTLNLDDLSGITEVLKSKINTGEMGIELLPALITKTYLEGLKELDFTKISIGIETFDEEVLSKSNRKQPGFHSIRNLVDYAQSKGLWVNTDIMVGLPSQLPEVFAADIKKTSEIGPDQITIYPYMVIRGLDKHSPLSNSEQFRLIEQAAETLLNHGYERKGVWTFARGENVYDSSRDELIEDYIGFGPAAFSTFAGYKIVNPELPVYIASNGKRTGFVAPKTEASDQWRRFARLVYDLRGPNGQGFPAYINSFIALLRLSGFILNGCLTSKGIMFAHHITKSVVESLPFPVQNPDAVCNYSEYLAFKSQISPLT
ncbi:radical SAM protein [candidate division WOR-3 bacterium]|uniref:Radical SAM protein n=1 Tax=candidate division WOR-3 bacterium TaxID=2052148 RepID=A0A9D5K9E3_UNCW3|nr:radical SAM protein [candidate division WOR-3 bacterium]MBD3364801.1 radical SAM protein [candidate division WOR-3 bacterium]